MKHTKLHTPNTKHTRKHRKYIETNYKVIIILFELKPTDDPAAHTEAQQSSMSIQKDTNYKTT